MSLPSLRSKTAQELFTIFAIGVGSVWIIGKLLRALASHIFPQGLPGEPNTALLASPRPSTGTRVTAKDLEGVTEYDYIIVGTGTAGCVLANRLSADPNVRVLAIEAGHSDLKQIFSRIPAGISQLFRTAVDFDIYTSPQKECANRKISWPRGKMIGGSSSMNAMMYNKGPPDDFDEWARLGNRGWSYKNVEPYMKRCEGFNALTPRAANLTREDLQAHGLSGPWKTGYSWITPITDVFIQACQAIGLPDARDFNTPRGMNGVAPIQTFIDDKGQRSSAAAAYLTADVVRRPNLKIASGQTVTRIIMSDDEDTPRAAGVEMASSAHTPIRYLARAKREVIVCAGAVHTPQILQLSGLGPRADLQALSIPLVADLPAVGRHLTDHLCASLVFKSAPGSTLHYLYSKLKGLPVLFEWLRYGTGPMTSQASEAAAFLRLADRPDAPSSLSLNDRTSGPTAPDLEIMGMTVGWIDNGKHIPPVSDDYFSLCAVMLRPESEGTVTLATADPFTPPTVDANYLSTRNDIDTLVYGLKLARSIARSPPFAPLFREWYWPRGVGDVDAADDAALERHVRGDAQTLYHPMCSARMGADKAESVVDDRLRVHGVPGLRVADASVFPAALAAHPCAAVIMVGEKAADLIVEDAKVAGSR